MHSGYFYQTDSSRAQWRDRSPDLPVGEPDPSLSSRWQQTGGEIVSLQDARWKHKTLVCEKRERFLSCIGNVSLLAGDCLAIVGPRRVSSYGEQGVFDMVQQMPDRQVSTISGLAEGVDSLCAKASIRQSIPTIAVLGGGLHRGRNNAIIGPKMRAILDHGGLVLSEFPFAMQPTQYTFPQRNRLIVAFSACVFVPYAGEKSGTMISMDYAQKYERDVWVLPSLYTDEDARGSNRCLQEGSVRCCVDMKLMLDGYFPLVSNESWLPGDDTPVSINNVLPDYLSDTDHSILRYLSDHGEQSIQSIAQACTDNNVSECIGLLSMLEMESLVAQKNPGLYCLSS